ncbi:hypothetical protein DPMN_091273 [Dreissena polymorpha]|uniref:Uncharacterized protein n=1 Tax=Dreissena polymorpha TaxID=45954 RepID=A0A9D4KZR1_DREPO|nr:hypothetical protein DPMN_091273 [Dreissena polymorpha]
MYVSISLNTPVTPDWRPYCVLTATQIALGRRKLLRTRAHGDHMFKVVAKGRRTSNGRCKYERGRREDAQNAINQDAGVTGRRKIAFLPKKSLASLLRQSEISRNTVLGRLKDASPREHQSEEWNINIVCSTGAPGDTQPVVCRRRQRWRTY